MATAPANGGMISGMKPSIWMAPAPRNSKRVVKYASGNANTEARTTVIADTYIEFQKDVMKRSVRQKSRKLTSVKAPEPFSVNAT